jgi:hypothetical protein
LKSNEDGDKLPRHYWALYVGEPQSKLSWPYNNWNLTVIIPTIEVTLHEMSPGMMWGGGVPRQTAGMYDVSHELFYEGVHTEYAMSVCQIRISEKTAPDLENPVREVARR